MFDKSPLFMQNKPNFGNSKMNINTTVTMTYVILSHWLRRKNKPNSKPIKPKTNPIKANTNPIQTQSNPISARAKMLEFTLDISSLALELVLGVFLLAFLPGVGGFCAGKNLYDCFNNATRGFYHPEGCVER